MPIEQLKEVLDKYDYIDFALLFGSYVDDSAKTLSRVFGLAFNVPSRGRYGVGSFT